MLRCDESAVTGVPREPGIGYAVRVCARFIAGERRRERHQRVSPTTALERRRGRASQSCTGFAARARPRLLAGWGFGQPLLFQYRILGQLLLSSTQGQLAFVSSSVIFLSHRRLTDWCRIWDYLMYGTALHTVITCATAPHSCNAQGCIRSATTQLSNVICGTDSPCRGRQ